MQHFGIRPYERLNDVELQKMGRLSGSPIEYERTQDSYREQRHRNYEEVCRNLQHQTFVSKL